MSTGKHIGNEYLRTVGFAVAKRRSELRISQEVAAELCGLDRSYMGRVEAGVQNITVLTLMMIGTGLGVTPSFLLGAPNASEVPLRPGRACQMDATVESFRRLEKSAPAEAKALLEKHRVFLFGEDFYYKHKEASPHRVGIVQEALYWAHQRVKRRRANREKARAADAKKREIQTKREHRKDAFVAAFMGELTPGDIDFSCDPLAGGDRGFGALGDLYDQNQMALDAGLPSPNGTADRMALINDWCAAVTAAMLADYERRAALRAQGVAA